MMKYLYKLCKSLSFFMLFCFFISSNSIAGEETKHCPDEKTLTRIARIALVNAQKLMGEKKLSEASNALTLFMSDFPREHHAYITYTLAGIMLETNHLSLARDMYEKTVNLCPGFIAAWQNMGKVCFDLKDYDRAAFAFERAWIIDKKKNNSLIFHAAIAHVHNNTISKALEHLFFLANIKTQYPEKAWVELLVNLSIEQKQSQKALQIVEKMLDRENPEAYLLKLAALLYLDLNHYKKAAKALSAYGMITPFNSSEQRLMADLYYNLGLPYKAACIYEEILQNKRTKKTCERAASAWYEAFEHNKSLTIVKQALTVFPDSHALWQTKGWIAYDNQNFQQANVAFSRAVELKKDDYKSLFMSGFTACKTGEYDKARKALKKAALNKQYIKKSLELLAQIKNTSGAI